MMGCYTSAFSNGYKWGIATDIWQQVFDAVFLFITIMNVCFKFVVNIYDSIFIEMLWRRFVMWASLKHALSDHFLKQ